ncbi:MAG: hypothetical protein K5637_04825 [Lachnospiraceae bacterium]|nr:hypothetical protein [Lachnospiraceae bacterium]
MDIQEEIKKVLTSIADNQDLAEQAKTDPAKVVRSIVGDEATEEQLANLTKGTSKLFGSSTSVAGIMSLLGNKDNISGLSTLFSQGGGISLIGKLFGNASASSQSQADSTSMLTQLLGSSAGLSTLTSLIGKKSDELPGLDSILGGVLGGQTEEKKAESAMSGILGSLTGLFKK